LPDTRSHRGPNPRDAEAFALEALPAIRSGVADLSWLLSRGYSSVSAVKLVGDRWELTERQRLALLRCSCSDQARDRRAERCQPREQWRGQPLQLDGFNVLTTIEAALGGAVVLLARDGCVRDVAGLHGTYRKVEETLPAIVLIGEFLADLEVAHCLWCLDQPVSNSGRLRSALLTMAEASGWDWSVELMYNPDTHLSEVADIVVSADSLILDRCQAWANLARETIVARIPDAWLVDLSGA
jgi:hypothetical protein